MRTQRGPENYASNPLIILSSDDLAIGYTASLIPRHLYVFPRHLSDSGEWGYSTLTDVAYTWMRLHNIPDQIESQAMQVAIAFPIGSKSLGNRTESHRQWLPEGNLTSPPWLRL